MADYFFDTTVLVAYFKKEDPQTHDFVARVLDGQATAAISAITIAEVWSASGAVASGVSKVAENLPGFRNPEGFLLRSTCVRRFNCGAQILRRSRRADVTKIQRETTALAPRLDIAPHAFSDFAWRTRCQKRRADTEN